MNRLYYHQVKALLEVQTDTLEATKRQVDKKQTRTVEERDQEIEEEEQGALPEFNEVCTCVSLLHLAAWLGRGR